MRLSRAPKAGKTRRRVAGPAAGFALRAAIGLGLFAATAFAPAHAAAQVRTVHPVLLSTDPYADSFSAHQTEVEPDITAHGSTLVSAFQVSRVFGGAAANIGWATSADGGRSWRHGFLPRSTISATPPGSYARGSDASVAYDLRYHTWLISWLGAPSITSNAVVDVLVSRSHDGIHWSAPAVIAARNEFLDKNWTACDNSRASRFFGNCYTEFEDPSEQDLIFMSTSTDGGRTWPMLSNTADKAHGLGGQPVVQPGGRVIVPINVVTSSGETVSSFVSDDGGATWSATHLIADTTEHSSAGDIRNGGVLPSARIDAAGRVYTVWTDCRFETGCTANDIVLSTSRDGITWTAPARIPIDPVGSMVDHFTPGLGVDPATAGPHAHLALTYYYYPQANCTFATCQLDVGYTSSANGGATWSAAIHVAGPMMLGWLAPTSSGYMAGDYIATAIVPGTRAAYPVFAAAGPPTGTLLHENIYTAPLHVTGGSLQASAAPAAVRPALAPRAGTGRAAF
jgi:hypothetical protein